jgi:hypothetical protein
VPTLGGVLKTRLEFGSEPGKLFDQSVELLEYQGVDGMPTERSEAVGFRQNRSEVESDKFLTQMVETSKYQGISANREGRFWWR